MQELTPQALAAPMQGANAWGFGEMWKIHLSFDNRKSAVVSVQQVVVTLARISPVCLYSIGAFCLGLLKTSGSGK